MMIGNDVGVLMSVISETKKMSNLDTFGYNIK